MLHEKYPRSVVCLSAADPRHTSGKATSTSRNEGIDREGGLKCQLEDCSRICDGDGATEDTGVMDDPCVLVLSRWLFSPDADMGSAAIRSYEERVTATRA